MLSLTKYEGREAMPTITGTKVLDRRSWRNQPRFRMRIGLALCALLLVILPLRGAAAFQLFFIDGTAPPVRVDGSTGTCPAQPKPRPVLFVHGHASGLFGSDPNDVHFQENWTEIGGSPSFREAVDLPENQDLGIEDYYIEFQVHDRSIVVDAQKIGEAIALIQACQNSANPASVKVAVIAYSKGTISTRLYLRSRQEDLSTVFPDGNILSPSGCTNDCVSEFVAIASPNHGLRAIIGFDSELPIRQLNDGVRRAFCTSYNEPLATDFMTKLNGVTPTNQWSGQHETPGNRADGDPVSDGTLFMSIYATGDRDLVGGESPDPDMDCNDPPRKQAKNLGQNAVNRAIDVVPTETSATTVHQAMVRDTDVICQALYAVANHRAPPEIDPPLVTAPLCPSNNAGVPIIPFGTGAVLVLDHSGSMGITACPNCGTKQEVLTDAVEIFLGLWLAIAKAKDRVGLTYFRTNVTKYTAPGSGESLIPLLPDTTDLSADLAMEGANSSGLTAMGGGLQSAILDLQGNGGPLQLVGPNRHIVLFTDGLQNVNPTVQETSAQEVVIANGSGVNTGIPTLFTDPIHTFGVDVHTIGIGVGQQSQLILQTIAQRTGGVSRFDTDTNALRQFFIMNLMDVLANASPQLVAYRYGTLQNDEAVETFPVNAVAEKVILKLSWQRGDRLTFRVEKGGTDVTDLGRVVDGDFYRIFVLDFPAQGPGAPAQPGGDWLMRVRGQPGTAYEAAAVVDEPRLTYTASLGERDYLVGDALEIMVQLRDGSDPVTGAEVTATVQKPSESIGNLLAAFPARSETPVSAEPASTIGQRMTAQLLQDPALWQKLQPTAQGIALEGDGKGSYRATLPPTNVPGVYTVDFEIAAQDPAHAGLRRSDSVSTFVRVGKTVAEASDVRLVALAETERGRELALEVTPRDSAGNHLGPDHGHEIALAAPAGVSAGVPQDLGNGTYSIPFIVADETDPIVTVTVGGKPLFEGPLSAAEPPIDRLPLILWGVVIVLGLLVLFLLGRWVGRRRAP